MTTARLLLDDVIVTVTTSGDTVTTPVQQERECELRIMRGTT